MTEAKNSCLHEWEVVYQHLVSFPDLHMPLHPYARKNKEIGAVECFASSIFSLATSVAEW
jgi:hypothetical protein